MEPTPAEIRVVGCLVEKQRATPDAYPLSLNALRLACNQSTNREPVVSYDDATVREALERLHRRGWTRLASSAGSRAMKYRHLLDRALSVEPAELAVLAVLMLRGPQTAAEVHARVERLHALGSVAEVEEVLRGLADRGLAEAAQRRAGQRGRRWRQLLGGGDEAEPARGLAEPQDQPEAPRDHVSLQLRVEELELRLAELERRLGPAL